MEGDISTILQCIMCSENGDLPRFVEFYDKAIKNGTIEETALYKVSKDKVVILEDEADEAKAEKKKLKKKKAGKENKAAGGMADLEAMILAKRNNAAGGFLSYMEQKYCKGGEEDLPDESAFERVAPGAKKRKPKAGASAAANASPKKRAKISK